MKMTTITNIKRVCMTLLTLFFVAVAVEFFSMSVARCGRFDKQAWDYIGVNFVLMAIGLSGMLGKAIRGLIASGALTAIVIIVALLTPLFTK